MSHTNRADPRCRRGRRFVGDQEYAVGGHDIEDQDAVRWLAELSELLRRRPSAWRRACAGYRSCVRLEVAMGDLGRAQRWKSSYSGAENFCVEVADLDEGGRTVHGF
jgi:hypothetical protein